MYQLRELDVNPSAFEAYCKDAERQYKLAKRDLADANRAGVQSWVACAMRKLNFARAEMRRAKRLQKGI